MSGISPEQVNRPIESNFRAFKNLVGEHSVEGDPSSLYNLTKSDPDPYRVKVFPSPLYRLDQWCNTEVRVPANTDQLWLSLSLILNSKEGKPVASGLHSVSSEAGRVTTKEPIQEEVPQLHSPPSGAVPGLLARGATCLLRGRKFLYQPCYFG